MPAEDFNSLSKSTALAKANITKAYSSSPWQDTFWPTDSKITWRDETWYEQNLILLRDLTVSLWDAGHICYYYWFQNNWKWLGGTPGNAAFAGKQLTSGMQQREPRSRPRPPPSRWRALSRASCITTRYSTWVGFPESKASAGICHQTF